MADDKKYPNSGALFQREAQGKRPTWSGNIELDGKLLRELVENYKKDGTAKLDVSGWDREGRKGPWISLAVQRFGAWKDQDGGNQRRPAPQRNTRTTNDRNSTDRRREDLDDEIPF